jgi:hypothetical protein
MHGFHAILTILVSLTSAASPAATRDGAPAILYEEAIDEPGLVTFAEARAERYVIVYQHLADPGSSTGTIDSANLLRYLGGKLQVDSRGWGVLDFEEPFDTRLQQGPASDRWKATVSTMVDAIQRVKRMFPNMRWTYYGMPGLSYYLKKDGKAYTWDNAPEELRRAEIARQIACYGPVLAECDWFSPCIYNTVGSGSAPVGQANAVRLANRAYVQARSGMCVEFARQLPGHPRVVPFASPLYQHGGGARCMSRIPYEILLKDCAQPVKESGADGLAVWTGAHCFIDGVTKPATAADFRDCGGRAIVSKTWAEDLNLSVADLATPEGAKKVRRMFSDAQSDLVRAAQAAWGASRVPAKAVGHTQGQ